MASINTVIRKVIQGFNKDEFTDDKAFNYSLATIIPYAGREVVVKGIKPKYVIEDLKKDFKNFYNYYHDRSLPEDEWDRELMLNVIDRVGQNVHFLPNNEKEAYFNELGYVRNPRSGVKKVFEKELKGRLRNKEVDIYRANDDIVDRDKLRVVGNINGLPYNVDRYELNNGTQLYMHGYVEDMRRKPVAFKMNGEYPAGMGLHSAAIYADENGKLYANVFDLNDYGKYGITKSITKLLKKELRTKGKKRDVDIDDNTNRATTYGEIQPLAEMMDILGNPTIIETGIFPLSYEDAIFYSTNGKYKHKINNQLDKALNEYIKSMPNNYVLEGNLLARPGYNHHAKPLSQPISNTSSENTMKKFGGKLKYGWGGFLTQSDFIDDAMTYRRNFDYIGSYGAYTTNGKDLDKYLWYSGNAPDEEALKNSYYVRYNDDDAYEKSGGDLDLYRQLKYSVEDGLSNVKQTNPYREDFETTTLHFVNAYGRDLIDKTNQEGKSIFINMQNKIAKDVARYRPSNDATNAKYGGLVNYRKKYDLGGYSNPYTEKYHSDIPAYSGNLNWGMKVEESDIPYSEYEAKGEGIVGSEMANYATTIGSAGAAIGTTAGLAAGTALGAWGGPIGMGIGALLGLLFGGIFGNRKRKEEEARRRKLLAEQKELNRQNTIGNMQDRHENDVAKIRTFNNNMSFNNNSFYGKFGGMLTRRKLEYGGHIIPNSADTSVAYGRTHEQINPQTGMTGVTYGDAEVEGGGFVNGQEYAGEVIRNTPMGDQIFSNSLPMPGIRATYAQVAKALTDKKGKLEKEIEAQKEAITASQEIFNKAKLSKAKAGTSARNIEKQATLLNRKVGELAEIESQLDQTFASQEELATTLGLRKQNGAYAKYGGYRPKYAFGFNEASLVGNIGIAGLNILANELTGRSNLKQLEFMRNLQTPKQAHVEAEYYNTDYDISNEIAMAAAQYNRNRRFITDNASNAQVLRNAIRKSDIDFLSGHNELRSAQKKYQTEKFNLNRNARVQANNTNRQIDYANLVADYNKNMDYYQAVMGVKNQLQQNRMAALNQLSDAFSNYASTKIQEGMWAEGVRDDMYGITTLSEKDVVKQTIEKDGKKVEQVLGVPMYNRKHIQITNSNGKKVYLPAGTKVQGRMYYDTKTRSWKPIRRYGV